MPVRADDDTRRRRLAGRGVAEIPEVARDAGCRTRAVVARFHPPRRSCEPSALAARSPLGFHRRSGRVGLLALGASVLTMSLALPATASIFKCMGPGGTPVYQESPCPAGKELRNFDQDPPSLSVIPGITGATGSAPAGAGPRSRAEAAEHAPPGRRSREGVRGDASQRRHVHAGMREGEVLAALGRPDLTAGAARKPEGTRKPDSTRKAAGGRKPSEMRWTWLPAPGDPDTITTVWIADGAVTAVERKVAKH